MSKKGRPAKVKEPIQVYLAPEDRALLDNIARASGLSRAEVLRRGIRRMSGELLGEQHPALTFLREMQSLDWPDEVRPVGADPGEWFDQELAKAYEDTHDKE